MCVCVCVCAASHADMLQVEGGAFGRRPVDDDDDDDDDMQSDSETPTTTQQSGGGTPVVMQVKILKILIKGQLPIQLQLML